MRNDGQVSLWDYYLENFSLGAQMWREGFTNAYDAMPDHDCEVLVMDREGHRFKTRAYFNKFGNMVFDATKGRGSDICWWREIR